jgi:uncharacterized membrane protein
MSEVPYEPVHNPPPPPNQGAYQQPPPNYGAYAPPPQTAGLSENSAGAIAYLTFIPAVLFLILDPYKKSHFIRFHAFQCIMLTVASIVIHMVAGFIPFLHVMLSGLISLLFFIVWLVTIIKASKGEWFKLPVIGDLAFNQSKI